MQLLLLCLYACGISHLPDKYSKADSLKLWFEPFHLTHFMLVDFDWFPQMKCQHVTDQTNFLTFLEVPRKLGRNPPDETNVFCERVQGWGNMRFIYIFICQTKSKHWCPYTVCIEFHLARKFVNYPGSANRCVRAGLQSGCWPLWTKTCCILWDT